MARLKMIIADRDAAYANGLADFLLASYAQTFEVVSFSNLEYLEQYLTTQESSGILLITPELAKPDLAQRRLVQILLSPIPGIPEPDGKQVFKYRNGPELVQSILQLYGEAEDTSVPIISSAKKTKVVSVYSPAGGTGKTTLAVGCSLQTAWEGNRVFYLNLENMPSTGIFFATKEEGGLSTVLFYLQDKKKNLSLKIEAQKITDLHSQIQYFAPADSVLDLQEELEDLLTELITLLKNSGDYDYVFVDLSSQLSTNNLAVLEASDVVLLVSTPEVTCQLKIDGFLSELTRWAARKNSTIRKRLFPVWNKWDPALVGDREPLIGGQEPLARIPRVNNLLLSQGDSIRLDLNGPFGTALYQVRASFNG